MRVVASRMISFSAPCSMEFQCISSTCQGGKIVDIGRAMNGESTDMLMSETLLQVGMYEGHGPMALHS